MPKRFQDWLSWNWRWTHISGSKQPLFTTVTTLIRTPGLQWAILTTEVADVWDLVQETFPGVRLESPIQGWAFLERFEEGIEAYSSLSSPSPKDDRWVGVCYFQLLRDLEALEVLYRAANRGEEGAHVYLAHVLPFVDRGAEATEELLKTDIEQLTAYDKALYHRVLSIREETNGNLREALRAAEEAWRRIQGVPEYAVLAPSILAQLAVLHGRIGRSQRALWFLERGLVSTTGGELLKMRLRRATVLVNLGRYREALVELDALELEKDMERYEPERLWLLGQIAMANSSLPLAIQRFSQSVEGATKLQFSYEELISHLALVGALGVRGDFARALEHLTRAQSLISDKSDRLQFRFREVLLNFWMQRYTDTHALQELEGLVLAFGEMGLLQEQALVKLHRAELLRSLGTDLWQRELDDLQALSISLQNPALLAREWALLATPDLREAAFKTHARIAGEAPVVLEVHTLGNERLVIDGRPVHIPLRRGVEVLAYFLENKAVSLRRIMSDVFPDEKPSAAKSYFHQFRHQLRENLDGVEIEYDSEAKLYRLKSEIDILWDVGELRAGRVIGETGVFLPSSGNEWVSILDSELDTFRTKLEN
ncbi:MAG: hypothetical protein WDA15_00860 [Trueperaceae bacterium]